MKIKLLICIHLCLCFNSFSQDTCKTRINYGNNIEAGSYATINGIRMYYEVYGNLDKETLLLIYGNGDDISSMRCQAEHFKDKYRVIIADSRFHGKTENDSEELTYDLMAKDYNALLDYLKVDSAYIIGQSDGGIIGLLLAMNYPVKVKKLVTMAPNLWPDTTAVHIRFVDRIKNKLNDFIKQINAGDRSPYLLRKKAHYDLMDKYPNIPVAELSKIKAPVLVMTSDADIIKLEHIFEIYHHIPRAQLFVMPGATHFMLREEYKLFNQVAERFLKEPFNRPIAK